ncbi:MAG TPA: hypothetical protein VH186_37165 [Chloroflexia bacterium]|nr:hypothetical protein [Chloroflexia bacterium]
MAERKEKLATCPVCGYQDTALDEEALKLAMQDHMQESHNLVLPVTIRGTDKTESQVEDEEITEIADRPLIGESPDLPGPSPDFGGATRQ